MVEIPLIIGEFFSIGGFGWLLYAGILVAVVWTAAWLTAKFFPSKSDIRIDDPRLEEVTRKYLQGELSQEEYKERRRMLLA